MKQSRGLNGHPKPEQKNHKWDHDGSSTQTPIGRSQQSYDDIYKTP